METGSGVQVDVLGPLSVRDEAGQPLEIPGLLVRSLLVRLALEVGRPVSVGTLADDLWGADAPTGGLNALQSLVSRLRRALRRSDLVEQAAGGYRLRLAPDGSDVIRFRELVKDGRAHLSANDPLTATRLLGDGLALWRGPVAEEVPAVAPGLADALDRQRLEAQADRIDAEERLGHAADCLPELTSLRDRHPLDERLAELEVRALSAVGRTADALRSYERIRSELAESLGVDPSPALRQAHLAALQDDAAPTPPRPAPRRGNLPATMTSFLGRQDELAEVESLFGKGRLVTILGPGGAGKTRLAVEAAARLRSGWVDSAWMVELAGVTDEADVPQAVLAALGLREGAFLDRRTARPMRESMSLLVDRLAGGRPLLVLDNCEHVIAAAATLADGLLGNCPDLAVLATSREPLAIAGEFLAPLAPPAGRSSPR